MQERLFLFTYEYPYGEGESFIRDELEIASGHFEQVLIFPLNKTSSIQRNTPSNCKIISSLFEIHNQNKNNSNLIFLKRLSWTIYLLIQLDKRIFFTFNFPFIINSIKRIKWILVRADLLIEKLSFKLSPNDVLYSYWFSEIATILCIVKKEMPVVKVISRAHGFDLYNNRVEHGIFPFRKIQIKNVNAIYTISKHGERFLKTKYPNFQNKIFTNYIGTIDNGINLNDDPNAIHLVSVSNIIKLKRLHLIIEILKSLKTRVIWTHFGDGELRSDIEIKSHQLENNCLIEFKGQKHNAEVIDFLKNKPVTCLINTSIYEGLPFSMIEAISFGIPIIGTDTGGVSEIVNEHTGMLIPIDFNANEIAHNILMNRNLFHNHDYRRKIKEFWKLKFSANSNYSSLMREINDL